MEYISTRGEAPKASAAQAVVKGIAADGGLDVPERFGAVAQETLSQMADWA